ncbi:MULTISPECIES: hypothetical protein [Pseudomonas]|uniref:Lipoprotein n=1 Tax=Pseudomonas fluorescens TaxID=294 RepID=A0A5E6PBC9_PSEFL|nr:MULTISPECIES: hypothetical protein [Pseudomonas]VVM40553.1 hypothetical protein PS652_00259 [Pseudomonas fluorescens]
MRKLLVLLPLMLLGGCSEDFATLHFQQSVSSFYGGLATRYGDDLYQAILALKIDPEDIEVELDSNDSRVILISVSRSLEASKRQALRELLDEIPRARAASSWEVDVTLETDAPDAKYDQWRESVERIKGPVTLQLKLDDRIEVLSSATAQERKLAAETDSQVSSIITCHALAEVSDGPFKFKSIVQLDDGPPERAQVIIEYAYLQFAQLPARFDFKDPVLKERIHNGQVKAWQAENTPQRSPWRPFEMAFEIGSLGKQSLNLTPGKDLRVGLLQSDCRELANRAGRPFSLFMGQGLDRLESVTYAN